MNGLRLNFHWVIDDFLAGCSRPGYDAGLSEDLEYLRDQGVDAIVSITEEPLDEARVRAAGVDYLHLFSHDGQAPGNLQLHALAEFVESRRREGRRTVIHCMAGIQRTMTGIAAYLIAHRGADPLDAITIAAHRRLGPGRPLPARITPAQTAALCEFAAWVRVRRAP